MVCGDSIRLGDTLTKLFDSKLVHRDHILWGQLSLFGDVIITIEHNEAYLKSLDELYSGMTCRIIVSGDLSLIEEGHILVNEETFAIDQKELYRLLQSEQVR